VYYDGAYAPYGENYAETGTTDPVFAGMDQDTISSGPYPLYDALYREYHPVWGRWVSPDPAGLAAVNPANPQSWNRYAYVTNNPLALVDPMGLQSACDNLSYGYGKGDCLKAVTTGMGFDSAIVGGGWDWIDLLLLSTTSSSGSTATTYLYQIASADAAVSATMEGDIMEYSLELDPVFSLVPIGEVIQDIGGSIDISGALQWLRPSSGGAAGGGATGTPVGPAPVTQQGCRASVLLRNGGPGAQSLVNNFSLFSYIPPSGGIAAVLSTPAAKTSLETLGVKGGILAGGYGLGKLLNLPALQELAAGSAGSIGSAASLITGIATVMDARARLACHD
jgi:RHS repeat-associated protein